MTPGSRGPKESRLKANVAPDDVHHSLWELAAVLAAVFVPFVLQGLYLYVAREIRLEAMWLGWPMLFLNAALGLVLPATVFRNTAWKWAPAYLLIASVALLFFSLYFGVYLGGDGP